MKTIKVDEEKLDYVASEASMRCDTLYTLFFDGYCDYFDDDFDNSHCNKCPFRDSESIKKWLKKE